MKNLSTYLLGGLLGLAVLSQSTGCDPIEPSVPDEDTTTVILPQWGSEIFAQATIGGETRVWQNAANGAGNGLDSTVYYPCTDQPLGSFKSQMTYFSELQDTDIVDVLMLEFVTCASGLNTEPEQDSIIYPGMMPFGSVDSAYSGVIVTYIDKDEKLWSSQLAPEITNDQAASTCFVSDVIDNYESYSRWIAAGSVECRLYDEDGNYINLSDGLFIARLGLYD